LFLPQPMHVNKRFVYLLVNKAIVKEYMYITHAYILQYTAAAAAESLQSCPTLCNHIDGSPPGSPVPGIFQAGVLEWGAIAFSDCNIHTRRNICVCVRSRFSHVQIFATPWTVDHRATLSVGLQARLSEWVAVPSSRGSSWSRHQTCVSCDYCPAGGFFTAETYSQYQIMGTDDSLILVLISCSYHLTCPYDWASYYWASYYWASKWLFDRWKQ